MWNSAANRLECQCTLTTSLPHRKTKAALSKLCGASISPRSLHRFEHCRVQEWSFYCAGMCTIEGNVGTTAATGTTPHTALACFSHTCQSISQALKRATGTTQLALSRDRYCTPYLVARHVRTLAGVAPGRVFEERERDQPDNGRDGQGLQVDGHVVKSPRHHRRQRFSTINACGWRSTAVFVRVNNYPC